MEDFLKALGVPESVIKQASAEGADLTAIAQKWKDDQEVIVAAKVKKEIEPELKKEIGADTLKAVTNTVKQQIKTALGLHISGIKDLSLEEFISEAKTEIDKTKTATDEKLTKELTEIREKYSSLVEESMALKTQVKDAEAAKEQAIQAVKNEYEELLVIDRSLDSIQWGFDPSTETGKARIEREKEIMRREIREKFQLDKDGKIKLKDGTPAIKPDESGVYKSVSEYIEEQATFLGLVKVSDPRGGKSDDVIVDPDGKQQKIDRSRSKELAKELGLE